MSEEWDRKTHLTNTEAKRIVYTYKKKIQRLESQLELTQKKCNLMVEIDFARNDGELWKSINDEIKAIDKKIEELEETE